MAKVSTSGEEARSLGFLRPSDLISMNRDRQVADAKRTALAMVRAGYHSPAPRKSACWATSFLQRQNWQFIRSSAASSRLNTMAWSAARLQTYWLEARLARPKWVSEQYILDLEREAFVSLCGERKTQERVAHTLKTGKPLRN